MRGIDALDAAEIGEVLRDAASESCLEWLVGSPMGPRRGSAEARRLHSAHTAWLHEETGRELGERLIEELGRRGYEIVRSGGDR